MARKTGNDFISFLRKTAKKEGISKSKLLYGNKLYEEVL